MAFSHAHPNDRGLLWSTRNTTFSGIDGQTQLALGMIAGVSDLIHFKDGIFTGIEIKSPNTTHKSAHVKNQLNWGEKIVSNGGRFFIVRSVDEFWQVLTTKEKTNAGEFIKHINAGNKSIKF